MDALSATMSKADVHAWIVDVLHEMFEIDKAAVKPESNLYTDLDIDSIDAVDLVVRLQELTGKRMQPEVFRAVRTVEDVVTALTGLMAE